MRGKLLKGKDSGRLLVFFTGWGFDERPFETLAAQSPFDVYVVYDYRELGPLSLPGGYREHLFLGWSLGGTVALHLGVYRRGPLYLLGATGYFCHERFGIPPKIYALTLQGLKRKKEESLFSFYERAFSGEEGLDVFLLHRPRRPLDELIEELEKTKDLGTPPPQGANIKVLITGKDRIIPPRAQRLYWEGRAGVERPFGHFPFYRFEDFAGLLSEFS